MIELSLAQSRILIIDDEESLRLTFERFLTKEGYGLVRTAATYEEALETLAGQNFDLIISDIVLEGASGINLLRHARETGMECPVVMITGYPNLKSAAEAVRLGAFDYLAKPVKKNDLLRVSRLALQQYALWKEKERLRGEKRRYRQYLETIFRSVRDAIITVDPDLRIVEMNQTARDWTGQLPEFRVGERLADGEDPFLQICAQDARQVLDHHQDVLEHRVECERRSELPMVMRLSAAPLESPEGGFMGAVLVLKDVTCQESLEWQGQRRSFHRFIGASRPMQNLYTLITHLGKVDASVLITGESGTGKELVADALHAESPRRQMPIVKVDCTAISEELLESELFGHRRGAFTGAQRDRKGRILQADGGTLFLDEIGDISPRMQLSLLRFLQEKTFYPVGQDTPIKVDVRVIAATNANLRQRVEDGRFREDLYFRLKVLDVQLPPLRERQGDLPLLAQYFIDSFGRQLSKEITGITDQGLGLLERYPWPGNVRELEHVIERACVLSPGVITREHLPGELTGDQAGMACPLGPIAVPEPEIPADFAENEEKWILFALHRTAGNKAKAARLLGFDRSTLYRKLRSYQIDLGQL